MLVHEGNLSHGLNVCALPNAEHESLDMLPVPSNLWRRVFAMMKYTDCKTTPKAVLRDRVQASVDHIRYYSFIYVNRLAWTPGERGPAATYALVSFLVY